MKLGRNLLFGLSNSIWSALITFAVVPLYLKYLGSESYGLIGFFTSAQALMVLLDLGLSSTINREVARSTTAQSRKEVAQLLHTLAIIYWVTAILIASAMAALSPLIANHWLQLDQLPPSTVSNTILLIGFVIACRWPIALYQGVLIGSQRLSLQSIINMAMVTLSHLGGVIVLITLSATIEAYFIWQAVVGLVYVFTIRMVAWSVLEKPSNLEFSLLKLKHIWRFTGGMSAISIIGLMLMQIDKIILSRLLSLEDFGHYMLATLLVSSLYLLITPVYNTIFPRFSLLVANRDESGLQHLYKSGSLILSSFLFPIAMILIVFSKTIVTIWTGNAQIATDVAPVVSALAAGSALHGVMYFPYALQLAYGKTQMIIKTYLVLLALLLPLTIILTTKFGAIGGATSWLLLHVIYLTLGSYVTHKELLKGYHLKWLTLDVGTPLFISVLTGILGYFLVEKNITTSLTIKLVTSFLLMMIAIIFSVLSSPILRKLVLNQLVLYRRAFIIRFM